MLRNESKLKFLRLLIFFGLFIAILSAFKDKIEWLSSFCGLFGDGCSETNQFTLLKLPVAFWGIGYYLFLGIIAFRARTWIFWVVMAGLGAELTFVSMIISLKIMCFFCILNFIVFILLFLLTIEKNRIWQALAVSLLVLVLSDSLLSRQNLSQIHDEVKSTHTSVVAKVGKVEISASDLETPLAARIYKLEKKIYEHKKAKLKDLIELTLLEMEAKQKGIPVQTLINRILSTGTGVSDLEVEEYYKQNRDKMTHWKDSEEKLKKKIRDHLQSQKTTQKIEDYTNPLQQKYGVSIYLKPPTLPFAEVDIDKNHFSGPLDAPVTIVEFSDYMCPSCRRAHKLAKEIKTEYQGKIKWVFKDYPLKRHEGAKEMAAAARCAGEQGKFWEYQDLMFSLKGKVNKNKLIDAAIKIGLNIPQFTRALESKKFMAAVEKDIKDAKDAGVSSTPTFIINGRLSPGNPSPDNFKQMIEEGLQKNDRNNRHR